MYTSNNINISHFLLDLKLGLPIAIKSSLGNYILLSSSENTTDKNLMLMRHLSESSTSIILNNKRMNYISKKNVKGELFSVSFTQNYWLCQPVTVTMFNIVLAPSFIKMARNM